MRGAASPRCGADSLVSFDKDTCCIRFSNSTSMSHKQDATLALSNHVSNQGSNQGSNLGRDTKLRSIGRWGPETG